MRAVIVEDHAATAAAVARVLEDEGLDVAVVGDGAEALDTIRTGRFALVVLDVRLPGADGVEVCRTLRTEGDRTPVLMLTGRGSTTDVVRGLEAGADDYLAKPMAIDEFRARVRALLRRGTGSVASPPDVDLPIGGLRVDPAAGAVRCGDAEVELTPREYQLLTALVERVGHVLPRERLLAEVWPHRGDGNPKVVDVYVGYLRRKLETIGCGTLIQTVRGVGYRIVAPDERSEPRP